MDTQRQPLTLTPTSSCACGEHDGEGFPELDVRLIPHAIRHATIFGALDSLAVGAGLVIIANHNPLPLLAQVQQRYRDPPNHHTNHTHIIHSTTIRSFKSIYGTMFI